ncbi:MULTISPECIES: hypothetical protein [Nocardioides]|uniref:hypothetical protein n=1 Tax=Nocardioides TaxID=1839 RepID=UPI000AE71B39|nr:MULTISPECIES: hypothetical protein [Nocardioides]
MTPRTILVQGNGVINDVCAKAPPGVDTYTDLILGWVKYGVLGLILAGALISIGAMVVGKIGSMGRAAQMGASGLVWAVLAAVAYVVIYGVLVAITGQGC